MDSEAGRAKEDLNVAMLGCRWRASLSGQGSVSSCEGHLSERLRKQPLNRCFSAKCQPADGLLTRPALTLPHSPPHSESADGTFYLLSFPQGPVLPEQKLDLSREAHDGDTEDRESLGALPGGPRLTGSSGHEWRPEHLPLRPLCPSPGD